MARDPLRAGSPAAPPSVGGDPLVIGLVNNMPDAALQATERQFAGLLAAAAHGRPVRLQLYALPELPRSEASRAHIAGHYESTHALQSTHLDGLIVTGTQPRARDLTSEPYWASLTDLVDWAEDHTGSTLWSCLAAHAAALYLDGIERHSFDDKLSGVFPCETSNQHSLANGFPPRWHVPQSRYYDLPHEQLLAKGYRVLSQSGRVGADLFLKQRRSLFVFCQGHLEYDRCTLMREYRADIAKFLGGERTTYPAMPCNYFDAETSATLAAFRTRAEAGATPDLLASLPLSSVEDKLPHRWRTGAVRLYENWLTYLAERKTPRAGAAMEAAGGAV